MKIKGIEGMSPDQIRLELQCGAKLVFFQYCVSAVVITFRRVSPVYFTPAEQSARGKGLPWTLLTLVAGWWGVPWGPIFTVQALVVNFKGGKDVTSKLSARLRPGTPSPGKFQK
jgi:hypothetical protein